MQIKELSTRFSVARDCDKSYIGETGRPFTVRMKEYQRAVRHEDMKNAKAVHSIQKSLAWIGRMPE